MSSLLEGTIVLVLFWLAVVLLQIFFYGLNVKVVHVIDDPITITSTTTTKAPDEPGS